MVYRVDILTFQRVLERRSAGYIKTLGHPAVKSPVYPLLYQSNQQQCTRNIIAKDTHIALHIERQFQMVFKRAVRHVERTLILG